MSKLGGYYAITLLRYYAITLLLRYYYAITTLFTKVVPLVFTLLYMKLYAVYKSSACSFYAVIYEFVVWSCLYVSLDGRSVVGFMSDCVHLPIYLFLP